MRDACAEGSVVLIPAPLAGTAVIYPRGLFILQCVAAATFVFVTTLLIIFVSCKGRTSKV